METNQQVKDEIKIKRNKSLTVTTWILVTISFLIIAAILIVQLLYDNGAVPSNRFYDNTRINGVDVTGMEKSEVANMISSKLLNEKEDVSIKLTFKNKEWQFTGSDFTNNSDIFPIIEQTFEKGRSGSIVEKIATVRKIKSKGFDTNISYRAILGGFDESINSVIEEINKSPINQSIEFKPDATEDEMFKIIEGSTGILVDKDSLYQKIDEAFLNSKNISIEVPVIEVDYQKKGEDLLLNTKLRSSFSTSYASSQAGRKDNIKIALSAFNGMVVEPGQVVSFNEVTGAKTPEKGYKKAKIILNGVYVEGYGGGVCQASTTLYNALILSDIDIEEVHPHSLPVAYVPLAFDAMVSEGYADLRFKNNLEYPIYIKAWGDGEKARVSVYGALLDEGYEIKRKSEFVEVLPHSGDMIIKDTKGEYSNKITYVGEYLRIKSPQEGYRSKAYIDYYKDGELVDQKLIRDEIYKPQKGIVMEGTEKLGEGMSIPENEVRIIPPQGKSKINKDTVNKKVDEQNPSNYNP